MGSCYFVRAQPFLFLPYVSIKTQFLVTNNNTRIGMVDVVHEPIDDKQAEMHIGPPADFGGFSLDHAVPIHPIFEACHLNANVAQWWNDHSSSYLPVLEYTDVNHCGLMCLNDHYQHRKSN